MSTYLLVGHLTGTPTYWRTRCGAPRETVLRCLLADEPGQETGNIKLKLTFPITAWLSFENIATAVPRRRGTKELVPRQRGAWRTISPQTRRDLKNNWSPNKERREEQDTRITQQLHTPSIRNDSRPTRTSTQETGQPAWHGAHRSTALRRERLQVTPIRGTRTMTLTRT